jgi:hypothetical protein
MQISQLFERPIERRIEPVVVVGNLEEILLQTEIEEFVITQEIGNRIDTLISAYSARGRIPSIGVWLSGYFGSGKSHLLKMLSFLLSNRQFGDKTTNEIFCEKITEDATLRNDILSLARIPSESILFNIDQQAEQDTATRMDSVLAVFVKMFNNHCGYFGATGHIAKFERDLDNEGIFAVFKTAYAEIAGRPWEVGRMSAILQKPNIDKAYARARNIPEGEVNNIIAQYQREYSISIDTFADLVKDYLDRKNNPNFRLNFFVDEVGQFIATRIELMLNLQSISETIGERCGGRSWIMVTSQAELPDLAKNLNSANTSNSQDFSRIQARFATKLNLTSSSVDEVLQRRLLAKTTAAEEVLDTLHTAQSNNYPTLFTFGAESTRFNKPFTTKLQFTQYYPFIPYQFELFQQAIVKLSEQGAFTGANLSVGARSLLASTQHALVAHAGDAIGAVIPFDAFYDGIAPSLREIFVNGILFAEKTLTEQPFTIRVLKALFLIKYVQGIEGTLNNLKVLLYGAFDTPMQQHHNAIAEALLILEQRAFIQRDGETYAYLTNEEKDIEEQIRRIPVDLYDIARELDRFVFSRTLNTNRFRVTEYNQDYAFSRIIDGHPPFGQTQELSVHVITPAYTHSDLNTIRSHTADKPMLTIVLPDTQSLLEELRTYKQTEQFVREFMASNPKDSTRALVEMRATQNGRRESAIQQIVKDQLAAATYICNMGDIATGNGDCVAKFNTAMFATIRQVYPQRQMITTTYDASAVTAIVTRAVTDMDEGVSNTEQELLNTMNRLKAAAQRITLKTLIDRYSARPFGWPLYALLAILANLYRLGKIEVRFNANAVEKREFVSIMANNNNPQNITVEPQIELSASQIHAIKTFYTQIFGETFALQSASQISALLKQKLTALSTTIANLRSQHQQYPFVTALHAIQTACDELANRPAEWYFNDFTSTLRDQFCGLYDDAYVPIRDFMGGTQRQKYDEAATLAHDVTGNAAATDSATLEQLRSILAAPDSYVQLPRIIQIVNSLSLAISTNLATLKTQAKDRATERFTQLIHNDGRWAQHTPQRQQQIDARLSAVVSQITGQNSLLRINQLLNEFIDIQLITILNTDMQLPPPPVEQHPIPGGTEVTPLPPVITPPVAPVYVNLRAVSLPTGMSRITNAAELERFLAEYRATLQSTIDDGKHILL